ncbi:uncharacterized protein ISCGN_013382 [Ixodes scapularis]
MYQVLIWILAVTANSVGTAAAPIYESWPATTFFSSTDRPLEPPDFPEKFLCHLEDRQMARHRGTFPDPLHRCHKRELLRLQPLGHDTLFGPYSRCSMYQVLIWILAVTANSVGTAAAPIYESWPATTFFSSTHRPLEPPDFPEKFLCHLEDRQMARHRGTFPDPLHRCHKRELLRLQPLGHDTLFGPYSRCSMYQVSYLNHSKCCRTSNVMLLRVSCPIDKRVLCRYMHFAGSWVIATLMSLCCELSFSFFETLLLLSGDVELNPGPMTKAQIEQLGKIETILLELQSGQMTVLGKLAGIEAKQADLERKFDTISLKTNDIEKRVLQIEGSGRKLEAKLDDLENRSRRTNLVFFGVPDNSRSETWEESERLITKICKDVLSLDVLIERAHRLGKHKDGKNRPIVVNFPGWKVKESVLRSAFKFKNTSFSVSEDFSLAVQEKRRQLWNYAKEKRQNRENKVHLNHDKLVINGQTFIWDSETRQPVLYRAPGQPREHE